MYACAGRFASRDEPHRTTGDHLSGPTGSQRKSDAGSSEWESGQVRRKEDYLSAEEPLEIRIGEEPLSVTMRTPGHDVELAAGFLFTEGLVERREGRFFLWKPICRVEAANDNFGARGNLVRANLVADAAAGHGKDSPQFLRRVELRHLRQSLHRFGARARTLRPPNPAFRLDPAVHSLACPMRCALRRRSSDAREACTLRRSLDRLGKIAGAARRHRAGTLPWTRSSAGRSWRGRLPLAPDTVLLVSGRGGFEIIQKAIVAGLPVVASVSAPSGLAVQLAREMQLTLIGFLRERRFVIYAGEERLAPVVVE